MFGLHAKTMYQLKNSHGILIRAAGMAKEEH